MKELISCCAVLFTKPGIPGRVKTRLVGVYSADQAAELHRAFVGDVVERLAAAPFEFEVAWALEKGEQPPSEFLLPGGRWFRQEGPELGARLHHGLAHVAERFEFVAALGSDHPDLSFERLEQAFDWLQQGSDVVFGPASDGGYYLVAARGAALRQELFAEIEWSTNRTLEQSVARAEDSGLSIRLLEEGEDVDTPEDVEGLVARLEGTPSSWCPRTQKVLTRWGLLGPEAVGGTDEAPSAKGSARSNQDTLG